MKIKKLVSLVLVLVFALTGVSLFGVSAESTYTQPEKFIYGDVDLDGDVTVKDATLIQKGLAKITYVTAVQRYLADPDGTGYSVKNATAIQKYLAKYETPTPWGTELEMTTSDEFSRKMQFKEHTEIDHIKVYPSNTDWEYTLEDFPEYDFNNIEVHLYEFDSFPDIKVCILYLSNPSKENIEDAIKALDYRANLDLKDVTLATYDIPL